MSRTFVRCGTLFFIQITAHTADNKYKYLRHLMKAIMKYAYLFTACLMAGSLLHAQTKYTDKDYARSPLWISMIKDTSANYFEVEKAYKIYFMHHEKPAGENDEIGEHQEREKHPSKREQRKMQQENHLRMDVKRYERWHDSMKPYVQDDGSILSPAQRIEIWKSQRSAK